MRRRSRVLGYGRAPGNPTTRRDPAPAGPSLPAPSSSVEPERERFVRELTRRFVLRWHMALILVTVMLSGIVASKLFLVSGVTSLALRYGLAVLAAYALFIALVKLWLVCVRFAMAGVTPTLRSSSSGVSFDVDPGSGSSGNWFSGFRGGGGRFGGGGASGSFSSADSQVAPVSSFSSNASISSAGTGGSSGSGGSSGGSWFRGGGGGFSLDLDDGFIIVVAFAIFVAVVAVAGGWVIYDAPHMFGEAAFQFFLASGLLRGARALRSEGWAGGWTGVVIRRTVIPFLIVGAVAVGFGYVAQKHCPGAHTVVEVFRACVLSAL